MCIPSFVLIFSIIVCYHASFVELLQLPSLIHSTYRSVSNRNDNRMHIKCSVRQVNPVYSRPRNDEIIESKQNSSFDPVTVAILVVYFVQGALGLARLATTFYLKDELHLSPVDAGILTGFSTIPWVIKPLYGFVSDSFPIFGYKRRSYLVLSGIVGTLSWIALATLAHDPISALTCILAGSASVAVGDVVADSIVVERSRALSKVENSENSNRYNDYNSGIMVDDDTCSNNPRNDVGKVQQMAGDLQSLCWGAASIGAILSAYFSGSMLTTLTPQQVFLVTSIFPLLTAGTSLLIDEKQTSDEQREIPVTDVITEQIALIWDTLKKPEIYFPVLFVFLWQATPTPDSAMFYFYTNELHFQPEFLGRVRLVSSIASLVGVFTYRTWLKDISFKRLIFWSTLISVPLGLTQLLLTTHLNVTLGIPDEMFVLTDSVVLSVLGQVAFMPILVLASTLCPPGIEGTLFASLMSIYNAAGTVASELGAGLTGILGVSDSNFDGLTSLVALCSVSPLLVLPFMNKLLSAVESTDSSVDDSDNAEELRNNSQNSTVEMINK